MNTDKEKPDPQPKPFIIQVDGLTPTQTSFRVMAVNEDEAFKIFENSPHLAIPQGPPRPMPGKIIKKKVQIRDAMSVLTTWVRNF